MSLTSRFIEGGKAFFSGNKSTVKLAANKEENNNNTKNKKALQTKAKAIARTRQDVQTWKAGQTMAQSDEPKNYALQLVLDDIKDDALLSSQIENRINMVHSVNFSIKNENGDKVEDVTDIVKKMAARRTFNTRALESIYYGYSVVENSITVNIAGDKVLNVDLIPRTNIVPQTGLFYPDYSEDETIKYREIPEFGVWVLEFNSGGLGLLNKAVSHVVFKRFAQSCWSELCEIYGIPPRVLKTNTQDDEMLNRAEEMMTDMGSAAWFIIDDSETFEFATGANTNGDVYKNLIALCSNELSLLISGALIGQDTKNGSRSKDESAQEMLWQLVLSDMALLEDYWTSTILPSLVKMGIIKPGKYRFEFDEIEDIDALWKMVIAILPYMDVDIEWLVEKFGIKVTGKKETAVKKEEEKKEEVKEEEKTPEKLAADFFD